MPLKKSVSEQWKRQFDLFEIREKNSYFKDPYKSDILKPGEIPSQFRVQPSKYAQRVLSLDPLSPKRMRLKYERGASIERKRDVQWMKGRKFELAEKLAKGMAELNVRYGVIHGDISAGNIVISKGKKGEPVVKLIDFEHSEFVPNRKPIAEWDKDITIDYKDAVKVLQSLCDTEEEKEKIRKHFRSNYEKAANKLL